MQKELSTLHKWMLYLTIAVGIVFGLGHYFIPVAFTNMLNINAPDIIVIICIGGFLIAAGLAAYLSLRANNWKEVRIATYYLTTWSLLNGIRLGYVVFIEGDMSLIGNAVLTLIIGIGLGYEVFRRYSESKKVSHIEKTAASH